MGPAVGEIGGRLDDEDALKVFVVLLVAFVGFSEEAEPHSPLVQKYLALYHIIIN